MHSHIHCRDFLKAALVVSYLAMQELLFVRALAILLCIKVNIVCRSTS